MAHSPMKTPNAFARKLASLQSRAWLPPALLLLALSSVFLFGGEERGYFYRDRNFNWHSAKAIAIADNLSGEHRFLMFIRQRLDTGGNSVYVAYNRFPIGGFALIKLAILPFEDDLSAKIYAARMLMLLCFAAAAVLAYLSLRRIASSPWIALTATLLAFSSAYCLYYSDLIFNEAMMDLFALILVFHGMVIFERDGRFRQLLLRACIALLIGWHVYALLLPFITFGLLRELIKARSGDSHASGALYQLMPATLSLARSRYLTLGVVSLLFGISTLTFNFTNEYFALNRETPLTELPSFNSMLNRTGVGTYFKETDTAYRAWPAFPERQLYRVGMMTLPYAFSPLFVEQRIDAPPRLLVMLGIAASGASLFGLLFIRRHKILLASLTLSGFCWALPMRYTTAYPWHSFEAIFYTGVALTLFSLLLLCLRRLSGERLIAALPAAALLIFVISALRMSQLNDPNQTAELHQTAIADFENIRDMTEGSAIRVTAMPRFLRNARNLISYYLSGRTIMLPYETVRKARTPDFVVTSARGEGLASLTPQNRMIFLYEWDNYQRYADEIIKQAGAPLIRSRFDMYLNDSSLMYVKDACRQDDISESFFLAIYPVNQNALPDERARQGFENLDFSFADQSVQIGERCIAIVPLPDYDIARIQTGQYACHADGSFEHLWEDDIHLTEAAR